MDERIAQVAVQQRAIGMQRLQWELDRWQYDMGMLEVLPNDDEPIARRLRTARQTPERPYRFLPFFNGYGVLVRDKVWA